VSVPQEIQIGREANAQVRKKTAELRDPQVTAYVARLGRRLAGAAGACSRDAVALMRQFPTANSQRPRDVVASD
jgi:predicted Zn-dependent protease